MGDPVQPFVAGADSPPSDPVPYLQRKLAHQAPLSREEGLALSRLLSRDVRGLGPRAVLVEQGVAPAEIHVLLSGWACRFACDSNGRRRIVAFHLPGDVCDFDVFMMRAIDQSIAAIGRVSVAGINRATLNDISRALPGVSRGLWWESMTSAAVQRAWTINVGQRSATRRIAHLMCELYLRLSLVGLAADGQCDLPLTQVDIADACALTPIHTNRALREMRADGLVSFARQRVTIHDWAALVALADFDGGYLHVDPALSAIAPVAMVPA